MDTERAGIAVQRIRKALEERYNVEPLAPGELSDAVTAVAVAIEAGEDEAAAVATDTLGAAIEAREMYRWAASFAVSIADLRESIEGASDDEGDEDLSKLTVPVLRERLAELNVEIPAGARKDDLVALLSEATAESDE